jgi:hypothetical protein
VNTQTNKINTQATYFENTQTNKINTQATYFVNTQTNTEDTYCAIMSQMLC